MEEPSVLDYLKSKLTPWKGVRIEIPKSQELTPPPVEDESFINNRVEDKAVSVSAENAATPIRFPWSVISALLLALAAQRSLEPPSPNPSYGLIFFALSMATLVWGVFFGRWILPPGPTMQEGFFPTTIRKFPGLLSIPFIMVTFLAFGGNRFTEINFVLWMVSLGLMIWALWIPLPGQPSLATMLRFIRQPEKWIIRLSPWLLICIGATLVVVFFRFYHLNQVPGEMFSDHAEKLLDVSDVLQGQTSIFFPRNTGREAIQMYLTAAIAIFAGTGLSFISLKIGTALVGLLTLPYIYLLGKEIGNRWVGLLAFVLVGIAYWPNVISRVGLRFPLYPLFTAPALYYLFRGLRKANRNDFLLAGLAAGLGLHGYSPARFIPIVLVVGVMIYLLHPVSKGNRRQTIAAFILLSIIAFIIFLPLMRYALEDPQMFGYRTFSRLGTTERPLPGPAGPILLDNFWNAVIMVFWKNGDIWVHSIPNRPALDVVTGALFFIGLIAIVLRYIRKRFWGDLFLLVSFPLLMMPSILSLAFPGENPSLNRTAGAIVPVFVIAGYGFHAILSNISAIWNARRGASAAAVVGLLLVILAGQQNYDLVFNTFNRQFLAGAWNTSQIGAVIKSFGSSIGSPEAAYVIPYPYWVDTRLVGINAGFPLKDYALNMDDISKTRSQTGNKLFILKPEDKATLEMLNATYPEGILQKIKNPLEGKDFFAFLVPGRNGDRP